MSEEASPSKTEPNKSSPVSVKIHRPRLSTADHGDGYITPTISPTSEHKFLVPSPMVTRRTRTFSASRRATEGPSHEGVCKFFSCSQGHGFIKPNNSPNEELIFMHISDIEGDYIPLAGDIVSYKLTRTPPKMEKFQAVEVRILSMCVDSKNQHVRWDGTPASK